MRNVLQLGLYTSAEWAILTADNWIERMAQKKKQFHLPGFYTEDKTPFRYFGVDVSPSSINYLREGYKVWNNVYFITCGISDKFSIEKFQNKYYNEETRKWYNYLDEVNNTLFVFVPFVLLLENIGIEDLSVLAVDIDGYEPEVFSTMNEWNIKPEFITVEISTKWVQSLAEMIVNAGYTHFKTIPQYTAEDIAEHKSINLGDTEYLHEQQFLRNDIYETNKHTIEIEHIFYGDL